MRDALEQEAAQVLLEIEAATGNPARLARRDPSASYDSAPYRLSDGQAL